MKSKKFLKILAALAVGTLMACTIAIAACADNGGSGSGSGNGDPVTHSHKYEGTVTSNNNGTHSIACIEEEGTCDAPTKNENCDTTGTGGACSKCGYKAPAAVTKSWTVTVVSSSPSVSGTNTTDVTAVASSTNEANNFKLASHKDGKTNVNETLTLTIKGLSKAQTITLSIEGWSGSTSGTGDDKVYTDVELKYASGTNATLTSAEVVTFKGAKTAEHSVKEFKLTVSADGNVTVVLERKVGTIRISKIDISVA